VSAALRWGEQQVRSNAAVRRTRHRHRRRSSTLGPSVVIAKFIYPLPCLLIWTHPPFERDSFFSFLCSGFLPNYYVAQTRHLLCFIYFYPHLPVGVSYGIIHLPVSWIHFGLDIIPIFSFLLCDFPFLSLNNLFSWNPFRSAHFIRCFGWEGLCHLA